MNEQLIVKNFGPITDATVDFKKVTVFIGPTGGGKSTLAKLAAIFRDVEFVKELSSEARSNYIDKYSLDEYSDEHTYAYFKSNYYQVEYTGREIEPGEFNIYINESEDPINKYLDVFDKSIEDNRKLSDLIKTTKNTDNRNKYIKLFNESQEKFLNIHNEYTNEIANSSNKNSLTYIPTERILLSMLSKSLYSIASQQVSLPKLILDFGAKFNTALESSITMSIDFLNITIEFEHENAFDNIIINNNSSVSLDKSASGIQSVIPLYVSVDFLNTSSNSKHSFVIEEPELNLYPTAQYGLMNWLVEKCTIGRNDLIITTHSPYILASCNLLMEAYKVWQDRPELEVEIEKIVPRASWINPEEFAAYYVADGTVRSIQDERTDLIGGNELDAVSGQISDAFRSLLRLKKQPA